MFNVTDVFIPLSVQLAIIYPHQEIKSTKERWPPVPRKSVNLFRRYEEGTNTQSQEHDVHTETRLKLLFITYNTTGK
jgi:hypothetical protein